MPAPLTRRLAVVLAVTTAGLAAPAAAPAAPCVNANLLPDAGNLAKIRTATLCLVNKERTKRGRVALKRNARLEKAAVGYARYMVSARFFAHVSPGGSTPSDRVRRAGYFEGFSSWAIGENLAWGSGARAAPAATVTAWMNSPGHRATILERRYRDLGVGVAIGTPEGRRGATYVNEFGVRR